MCVTLVQPWSFEKKDFEVEYNLKKAFKLTAFGEGGGLGRHDYRDALYVQVRHLSLSVSYYHF